MLVVDAHQDIAYNALCNGRDYRISALRQRLLERAGTTSHRATIGLPEGLIGRLAVVIGTIFTVPHTRYPSPWGCVMYRDQREAETLAARQMDYYERLTDEDNRLRLIRTVADLDAVIASCERRLTERQQGMMIMLKGVSPIREPKQFEEWYERGVRVVAPGWQSARYAGETLTRDGHELLEVMADLGTVLDVIALPDRAYFQALERYEGPVIASSSVLQTFSGTQHGLSDAMIRDLAERDGVLGLRLANHALDGRWHPSDGKRGVPLVRVVDAIDQVCQMTGSAAHIGIGSAFDSDFGAEATPDEIDTVADLWLLGDALQARGFDAADIAAVLGGNLLRKLREGLNG